MKGDTMYAVFKLTTWTAKQREAIEERLKAAFEGFTHINHIWLHGSQQGALNYFLDEMEIEKEIRKALSKHLTIHQRHFLVEQLTKSVMDTLRGKKKQF